jgi:hypothetical protein
VTKLPDPLNVPTGEVMPSSLLSCAVVWLGSLKSSTRILFAHSVGAALTPAWEKATNSGVTALALSSLHIGVSESGTAIERAARIRTGKDLRDVLNQTLSIILYSSINIVWLVSKPDGFQVQPLSIFTNSERVKLSERKVS